MPLRVTLLKPEILHFWGFLERIALQSLITSAEDGDSGDNVENCII